jgi:hypothetical protein
MKRLLRASVAAATMAFGLSAHATTITVYDTSLPDVNGAFGGGTATTTYTPGVGKSTFVAGPGGGANRASAPLVSDQWIQRNVGGDAAVGILTDRPRSGNGSAGLFGTDGDSKADLEHFFSSPIALSDFGSLSYDWYREGFSTAPNHLHPAIRLIVAGSTQAGLVGGYLVFERAYNPSVSPVPTDMWLTDTIDFSTTNLWGTSSLGALYGGYDNSVSDWLALVPNLQILGLSFGIGSGWNGSFLGYVDNVTFTADDAVTTWNFEVETQGEVSEPATLALLLAGIGGFAALRRRKTV